MTLDFSIEGMEVVRDPEATWLDRRRQGFGCSDLGALWLALGLASPEEVASAPRYMLDAAETLIDHKAGRRAAPKVGSAARMGRERERLLFDHYRDGSRLRAVYAPDVLPQEMLPLVDRVEPRLLCTPDGWITGNTALAYPLAYLEIKCGRDERAELPWYWRLQCVGAACVLGCDRAVVVFGPGWARDDESGGEPVEWWIDVTPGDKTAVRLAVGQGWKRVEARRVR